jgi:uncharacterized MAPEG superfamily protein
LEFGTGHTPIDVAAPCIQFDFRYTSQHIRSDVAEEPMTTLLQLVVWMTLLTWVSIMAAAFLRNREWTPAGIKLGLGNRDNLPDATPLGGRAVRAASNTQENFILFTALALTAHAVGVDEQATLGAQVFFWARLVYLPVYWAGITYVRSLLWGAGTVGLALMLLAILP